MRVATWLFASLRTLNQFGQFTATTANNLSEYGESYWSALNTEGMHDIIYLSLYLYNPMQSKLTVHNLLRLNKVKSHAPTFLVKF